MISRTGSATRRGNKVLEHSSAALSYVDVLRLVKMRTHFEDAAYAVRRALPARWSAAAEFRHRVECVIGEVFGSAVS